MKRQCKYVMTRAFGPILFGEGIGHNELNVGEIVSAGFCEVFTEGKDVEVSVYGKSTSLRLESKPEDAEKIRRLLTGYTEEEMKLLKLEDDGDGSPEEDEVDYGDSSNPEEVKARLNSANAEWTPEGWVVTGDLNLSELKLTRLPKINSVGGSFDCFGNKLTSLQGAPQSVKGDFICSYNKLTSLQGSPQTVGGDFACYCNKLISLQGGPKSVGGSFYCRNNPCDFTEADVRAVSNVKGRIVVSNR